MVRALRMVGAALVLGTLAFGATSASAHGFGGGFGGFHGGGFHGAGFHGGWGHGWGHGWGWGYRGIAFRPFGGCYIQRYVDVYGDLVARRICY